MAVSKKMNEWLTARAYMIKSNEMASQSLAYLQLSTDQVKAVNFTFSAQLLVTLK